MLFIVQLITSFASISKKETNFSNKLSENDHREKFLFQMDNEKAKRDCRSGSMILCGSEIWKHLLSKVHCANSYFEHNFKVITKCRSLFQLRVWELVLIK